MFEDNLIESRVVPVSSSKRLIVSASFALQCAVAATLAVVPLLHPERLIVRIAAPTLLTPLPPKPPLRIERPQISSVPASTNAAIPGSQHALTLSFLHLVPGASSQEAPPSSFAGVNMPSGIPEAFGVTPGRSGPQVSVAPAAKPPSRVRVSAGVSAGMLMAPIRPVYPAIAKATGVQGTVVVEAVISRTGTIESLHVVSGPPMLTNAALDAIRAARYQPYKLNGEPTEVETTFTINFRMGS